MDLKKEKTLSQQEIYHGKIINLSVDQVELQNGEKAHREWIHHPGGVGILAINEQNEICLVRQFRYPYHEFLWEIPAGKKEPSEPPLKTALRELSEETGFAAAKLNLLGEVYPSPGILDEVIHLYLATDLIAGKTHPDEDEFLECRFWPIKDVLKMIEKNEIKDAKTVIAVLKLMQFYADSIN